MIGRRIGHCDVLSRLGEGGMGQVFAGIDRSLDRPVAIKALRPELSRDPAFAARFRAEAGALARLSHPNVAHIYSLEQSGSQQFMILELVRGLTGLGYRLRESWVNPGKPMVVALRADRSLDHYSGYCFDLIK